MNRRWTISSILSCLLMLGLLDVLVPPSYGSTYVVYIPLDSPIYEELETLNALGYLDTYIDEIKPISRVEAARLTVEAGAILEQQERTSDGLASALVRNLREQLAREVGWIDNDEENDQPTMIQPVQRLELQYIFSRGDKRHWDSINGPAGLHAAEGAPLLPNNDGLPTAPGSNEIVRLSGWGGLGGFLTFYGEGAAAGPFTRGMPDASRLRALGTAVVASFGNSAISLGTEEMSWGLGHFTGLSQSNNAQPFPALRWQNVHPSLLPWVFRYLGQFRYQVFFGQLDDNRYFAHPWIDGQIVSFKPLPSFEFGFNHTIDFGGRHNDNYSVPGFIGRATGFATGNPTGANTNSRAGAYAKLTVRQLRRTQLYAEILGEDFYQPFGRNPPIKTPFKSPSYTFGVYTPRLTADGLTDAGAEYTLLDKNYETHDDSLYWTYQNGLMADPLGPAAWRVNAQVGRWINYQNKVSVEFFLERRSLFPLFAKTGDNENGLGGALDLLSLPFQIHQLGGALGEVHGRVAAEYVQSPNYVTAAHTVRLLFFFSGSLQPNWWSWAWR